MAIAWVSTGSGAVGTTTMSVPYPASLAAGNLLVMFVVNKYPTNAPATPPGWIAPANNQFTGGAGAAGADSGTVYITVFIRVSNGAESGSVTVNCASGNSMGGRIVQYSKTSASYGWAIACNGGADNSAGTDWSVTAGADPGLTAGDMLLVASGINGDAYTYSAEAVSAAGISAWGTVAERADTPIVFNGDQCAYVISEHPVTTGTSTAAPVFSMTASGTAGNAPAGASIFVRLRECSTTGAVYPTAAVTAAEDPWLDNDWTTPTNIYSDDANTANITEATFDSPDQSYVLKAYTFDFSAIPDGSTIHGVVARINAWYRTTTGAASIDLLQLLNTSLAKVGTNVCATPSVIPLTTTDTTVITIGGELWGNALTAAWVKNSNFGVAIGVLATAANSDVDVDYVTLEVYYTAPSGSTYNESVTLAVTAGQTSAANIIMDAAVTLATAASQANAGGLSFQEALTLAVSAGMTPSALLDLQAAVTLAMASGMTPAAVADLVASVSLPASVAVLLGGNIILDAAITLAGTQAAAFEGTIGGQTYNEAVTLALALAAQNAANYVADVGTVLAAAAGSSFTAQLDAAAAAIFQAAASHGSQAQLDTSGSVSLGAALQQVNAALLTMDVALALSITASLVAAGDVPTATLAATRIFEAIARERARKGADRGREITAIDRHREFKGRKPS